MITDPKEKYLDEERNDVYRLKNKLEEIELKWFKPKLVIDEIEFLKRIIKAKENLILELRGF